MYLGFLLCCQTVIMYLVWDSVIVASWTTMLFYIPLRVILIVLCLWFYVFDYICSKFIYNMLFCIIQVWHIWIIVDLNGTKWRVVTVGIRALVYGKPLPLRSKNSLEIGYFYPRMSEINLIILSLWENVFSKYKIISKWFFLKYFQRLY